MIHFTTRELYLGVGNTVTARTDDGDQVTGIVSRRKVGGESSGLHAEIALHFAGVRTFLLVPYVGIVAINGEPVRITESPETRAAHEATALARATGSVSATVRHERDGVVEAEGRSSAQGCEYGPCCN